MSIPIGLSKGCLDALHHMKGTREINTVIFRLAEPNVLVVEVESNLTHDELIQALPADEARLVAHELFFATPKGSAGTNSCWSSGCRRMPAVAGGEEEAYTVAYTTLKDYLADVHVHLTARRTDQLEYRRLVALAG